ncbi:MAG: dTDP-glucose 4,6-dehydratase [Lutisporaceae bacterium]
MKVVITGGAGFIGSNFIQYLQRYNKEAIIINIDKLTYAGDLKNLRESSSYNYRFYQEDICNFAVVDAIFEEHKPQYVLNFAAESHVDRSIESSRVFIETNVLGTQVLLQAAHKHNVSKFIQISTDEVYGAGIDYSFVESDKVQPGNPYAASKAAADLLVLSYHHTYGLPAMITRCTNNFGPYQHKEKLIPMVIDRCLSGQQIPIYGDGLQMRDWIYVEDHCSAVLDTMYNGRIGEIYNISSNNRVQNIQLVKKIIKELKLLLPEGDSRKLKLNDSLISYVEDRKGHDRCYSISAQKLIDELGWSPTHAFDEALKSTIKWYIENV